MAEKQTELGYHNIELYKAESVGFGSFVNVYKAKCDGLICAAKSIHSVLIKADGSNFLHRFEEHCHLLSKVKHPNIVQYLATYYDPDTRLPVLLMELCDESLTAFLERSPGSLSYHVQLNICLDTALALVYLHSNGLIHCCLDGNHVLIGGGSRAKIAVSIMSTRTLIQCPGTLMYMSPEAINGKSYTAKLDIFSFGVIVIQILTRQFPNPTEEIRFVHDPRYDKVQVLVPETERLQAHLQLIPDTHSLKPLALQCLKNEMQRPSALQLSERLSELKQAPQYTESMHQAQTRRGNETGDEIATLRRQVQDVQQQNIDKEQLNQQLQQQLEGQRILTEAKTKEASEHQARSTQLQRMVEAKDRQLQNKQIVNQHAIETKERQLQQTQQQLRDSQQLVAQFQQSLQRKDKTISDLQLALSHYQREIQQLKQQDMDTLDLFDVKAKLTVVAERWQDIGLALRLRDHDLGAIATGGRPVKDCLTDMLRLWLNKAYDVEKYGEPSWHMLAQAVRHPAGGNNAALAEQIFPQ